MYQLDGTHANQYGLPTLWFGSWSGGNAVAALTTGIIRVLGAP